MYKIKLVQRLRMWLLLAFRKTFKGKIMANDTRTDNLIIGPWPTLEKTNNDSSENIKKAKVSEIIDISYFEFKKKIIEKILKLNHSS